VESVGSRGRGLGDDGVVRLSRVRQRWWWIFGFVFVLGLVSLVVWLGTLTAQGRGVVNQMVSAVSGYTALAALVIAVIGVVGRRQNAPGVDVERELAGWVKDQWAREAVLRQASPVPLRVRWSSTGRPVAAGRDVVLDEPAGADWRQLPLEGDIEAILAAFRGLPYRQLVLLGEPGAGKSVLAMRLTLELIKDPEVNQSVPVLLPLASWNPTVESPQEFLIRRLSEEYEFLAEQDVDGCSRAERLVRQGRVLPVLDGLDELPEKWHGQAVEALDRFAAADRPLVLTCRTREYEHAVTCSGVVLARAAVVEIEPVDVEQAIEFLSHSAPAPQRWQPVFEHLRQQPHSPLAKALSTPLMVVLARIAYRRPTTNPAALLTERDRDSVVHLLIEGFVSSVYQADHPTPPAAAKRQRLRSYGPDRAARWLSCLAYHLYQDGTRDLWWWRLSPGLLAAHPTRVQRLTPVLTTLLAASVVGGGTGLVAGVWPAVRAAVVAAVVVAVSAAGVFRSLWPGGYPPYVLRRYRTRRWCQVEGVVLWIAFGVVFGLMTGLLINAPVLGLTAGLVCGGAAVITPAWSVSTRSRRSTPRLTVQANHRHAATAAAQHGLIGGVLFAVAAGLAPGSVGLLTAGCTAGLVYAMGAAGCAGGWTWIRFRLTHLLLAMRGWLPWRLWAFLDDAHRRGTLRQAGTAWQFRHALLQDHLARKVHPEHLRVRADAGDREAAWRLAELLDGQGRVDEAIAVLQVRADAGDKNAAWRLAELLDGQGRVDEAIAVLQVRADAGDKNAAWRLAGLLASQGRVDEAIAVLQVRADAGDKNAAWQSARLLAWQGRVDELRVRADAGDRDAAGWLAGLLAEQGRVDELRVRADAGDEPAAWLLAGLLAWQGRVDELQVRADAGDREAAWQLAELLDGQGRVDEVIDLLQVCADAGDREAARRLAELLAKQGQVDELRVRADAGDREAAWQLAHLLAKQGRVDEVIDLLQVCADAGDSEAARRLAGLLAKQGRVDELRVRADAGDREAAWQLAELLDGQGRVDELRVRADAGDEPAAGRLVGLLAEQGRVDELRVRADAGDEPAAGRLVGLLAEQGRVDELRVRADAGDEPAAGRLVGLLAEQGRVDELRVRADAGDQPAAWQLARLLAKQGRVDELQVRADAGDREAARRLAGLLAEQGRVDELRARADAGDREAAWQLAELLDGQGRVDEAIALLQVRADAGDEPAAWQLVGLLDGQGRVDEAIALLQVRANAGDREAARWLAELLDGQGRVDEVIDLLQVCADAGDQPAARRLAGLLAEQGRVDELRVRADAGDREAAWQLAELLAEQGRVDEL